MDRLHLIIDRLRELGVPIDDQIAPALASHEAVGRPHIARAMVAAGHVATVQEAFDKWIDRNGPAYVPRQGMKSRAAIDAIIDAHGIPVLAHYPAAPEQPTLVRLVTDWGIRGLEVYYRRFAPQTVQAMEELCGERGLLATGGSDYHGDTGTYAEAMRTTYVPRAMADRLMAAIDETAAMQTVAGLSTAVSTRMLPVFDARPAALGSARPKVADELTEFTTDEIALPSFHVWTLGCQMNHSDSEEMAGALAAAGCAEAPSLESADLIVINSCAIREAAEQKVIGRMGHLARMREANPALRVVLTGCSVRTDNVRTLHKRYPQVDLFLRPDEEPELTARLGLAGATAPGRMSTPDSATEQQQRLATDHLRLRQDMHVLHRALLARPRAQPAVRRGARRGAIAGDTGLPRSHIVRPERQLVWPRPARRGSLRPHPPGTRSRSQHRPGRPPGHRRAAARDRRAAHRRRRPRNLACPLRDLASVGSVGSVDRVRWQSPLPYASTCTCRFSRATTQSFGGWAGSTRSMRTCGSSTSSGSDTGHHPYDGCDRGLLWRD